MMIAAYIDDDHTPFLVSREIVRTKDLHSDRWSIPVGADHCDLRIPALQAALCLRLRQDLLCKVQAAIGADQ